MKIKIDDTYKAAVEKTGKKLRKYTFLFDIESTDEFGFELEDECMSIWYGNEYETKTVKYPYEKLRYCDVRSNGYVLAFRDKRFLFLPVTDDEKNNVELLEIGEVFSEIYDGLHFVVSERLIFNAEEEKKGKKKKKGKKSVKVGFELTDDPIVIMAMGVLGIIAATFVLMFTRYDRIPAAECEGYTGVFDHYSEDGKGYIDIYFEDGERIYVHEACVSAELRDKMDALEKGNELSVLTNPATGFAIEVRSDSGELLNIDTAQKALENSATVFLWICIAVYCGSAFLIPYGIYQLIKERSKS